MKNYIFATAAFSLPAASRAFLAPVKRSIGQPSSSSLFQQYYDQGGQYYEGYEQQDHQGQYQQQQYYGQDSQQQYYTDEQQQQQQYYEDPQQQQQQQQHEAEPGGYYDQGPSLVVTGNMHEEMARATSGVEVGGMDYLALARQRAATRVQSNNSQSTDADWHNLAEEKRRQAGTGAGDEDWEKSLDDEGSINDSAVLGVGVKLEEYGKGGSGTMVTEGGVVVDGGGEGEDGPQLLL